MTQQFIPHPPSPTPEKPSTNIKQIGAIVFLIAVVALLLGVLIAPSDESSTPDTTVQPAPVVTEAPVVNKYDAYLEHVYNNSGQANSISKADLIEYGDIVCEVLDNGNSIAWVVNYLSQRSSGNSDNELYASVVYGAITYICDEYTDDLRMYLNS